MCNIVQILQENKSEMEKLIHPNIKKECKFWGHIFVLVLNWPFYTTYAKAHLSLS